MKTIGNIISIAGITLLIWILISWIDINNNNDPLNENYKNYANWNFFTIVGKED